MLDSVALRRSICHLVLPGEDPIEQRPHALFVGDLARERRVPPLEDGLLARTGARAHSAEGRSAGAALRTRNGETDLDDATKELLGGSMSGLAEGGEGIEHADRLRDSRGNERGRRAGDAEEEEEEVVDGRAKGQEGEKASGKVRDGEDLGEGLQRRVVSSGTESSYPPATDLLAHRPVEEDAVDARPESDLLRPRRQLELGAAQDALPARAAQG